MEIKRAVIELEGNLTFCGIHKGEIELEGVNGVLLETDKKTGLKVWCPQNIIKDIIFIPISEV